MAALGVIGLALIPAQGLADGIAGIVPGLPLIVFVMLYSAGQHMGMLIERAIVMDHGDLATAGSRLGKIGFWKTLAGLAMAGGVVGPCAPSPTSTSVSSSRSRLACSSPRWC